MCVCVCVYSMCVIEDPIPLNTMLVLEKREDTN